MKIDEANESFVSAIALVENPAIESDFIAFSKIEYFAANDEKQELLGAAMIPDKPIYRNGDKGDFYAVFSKDTIRQIAQVFAQKGLFNNTNIEHTIIPADSYVFQSITDERIPSPAGLDLPLGSWVVGVKVNNPTVWQAIKKGQIKGFSVEGIFSLFPTNQLSDGASAIDDLELSQAIREFNAAIERLNNNG
ncbi:XkdF-like putative serine protease domain-containing protein [Mucilaginibacter sp.]|uniref:XkdF-like putative serine protease domain-containing protein n=1 Tax=Mucilaginibacter sp. TaxID=1882438 RepID=UPI003D0EE1F2